VKPEIETPTLLETGVTGVTPSIPPLENRPCYRVFDLPVKDAQSKITHSAGVWHFSTWQGKRLVLKSFVRDKTGSVNSWFVSNTREKLDRSFMPAGGDSRFPNSVNDAKADPLQSSGTNINQNDKSTSRAWTSTAVHSALTTTPSHFCKTPMNRRSSMRCCITRTKH
jgi:hypothetical protein